MPTRYEDEQKTRVNLALTPTGVKGLDCLAKELDLSRSELVEQIGRGLLPLSSESENLPSIPAVYLILEGNCVLYVGQSVDLRSEVKNNLYLQEIKLRNINLGLVWIKCSEVSFLPKLQKILVQSLKPRWNKLSTEEPEESTPLANDIPTISVNIPIDFITTANLSQDALRILRDNLQQLVQVCSTKLKA
ncbi:MAG: hypothetical protein F6K47_07360 [Symploca sp. SIO2E6]|nr:hypothetical protein [Symploca sp. SIO2E6]